MKVVMQERCTLSYGAVEKRIRLIMATATPYMAVRATGLANEATEGDLIHHFDVSCAKCRETYAVWGPGPDLEEELRQGQEYWLTEHLQAVCPFHRDSFPLPLEELT